MARRNRRRLRNKYADAPRPSKMARYARLDADEAVDLALGTAWLPSDNRYPYLTSPLQQLERQRWRWFFGGCDEDDEILAWKGHGEGKEVSSFNSLDLCGPMMGVVRALFDGGLDYIDP